MTQTILLRRSSTANSVPTTGALQLGEVVVNTYDGIMYMMKNNGTASIVKIGPVNAADITAALGSAPVTSVTATGPLASTGGATPNITISQSNSTTSGYLSSTDWNTFNGKQAALGYTPINSTLLGAANGVATLNSSGQLTAAQIPASLLGAMQFQSVWNASTNTPALTSSTGTAGNFYIVSVAGTTALNGITQWNVGDMAVFDGGVWNKIDGQASEVTSVAGRVGAVTLAYADISGLGTMAQQTASSVAITGGTISGVTITGNISGTASNVTGTVAVANGGTGVTSSTGTGSVVLSTSPTLVTPALGTPSSVVLTNATGTAAGLSIGGTAAAATNIGGGAAGSLPYQTATGTTGFLGIGSTNQVLTVVGGVPTWQNAAAGFVNPMTAAGDLIYGGTGGAATRLAAGTGVLVGGATPSYTTTPTLTGTNFSGIPNTALTNSSVTIGSTAISLGATSTSLAGLSSVTSTTFVGALTGLASGNLALTGGTMTGGLIFYGATSISAAGTTQATATALTADYNYVTTVAASAGVILPTPVLGREITVVNRGANPLTLYPATGGAIDGAGTNNGVTIPVNGVIVVSAQSTTQWFTVTPVYAAGTGISITQSNNGTVTFATSAIPNSSLANSTITLGSTSMALGTTNTTIVGLTSVTSTTFVGNLTGNASGTASNVTGTVAIANGGTGATSASAALTALGAMAVGVTIDGGAY